MVRDELVYLPHILDAIHTVEEYLHDVDEEKFKATRLLQDGAIRHISKDIRKAYPEIPWQDVAGMRDKLIHGYFGVDIEKVWDTAQDDLPILKQQMLEILKDFGQGF
jgi:uncharacterized protein with HEPN domain